jgi:hypothetical protein
VRDTHPVANGFILKLILQGEKMSDDFYKELYASAQEALAIAKGEIEPSRVFTYERPNTKANYNLFTNSISAQKPCKIGKIHKNSV